MKLFSLLAKSLFTQKADYFHGPLFYCVLDQAQSVQITFAITDFSLGGCLATGLEKVSISQNMTQLSPVFRIEYIQYA